jgi:carbon-monoxide dehydrogenase medium subunit
MPRRTPNPAPAGCDRVFSGANMPRVSYTAPTTIDDAVKALSASAGLAKVLSGGTDLLVQMKSGRARPELIVDTKRIPGMIGIREEGDKFIIGAATPGVMISADERLVKAYPGIVEGVDLIGSTQIQGRASIAGNLCNGSPAADSVPPVIAARGTAVVAGPNGRREVPVESIVTGPGQTSLQKGELVVEFRIPKPKSRQSDAYLRFIPRTEMDIAVVGCAVNVTLDAGGTCTDARVVLGAVAPTQLIVDEAAQALIGHKLDDATLQRLDAAARAACRPITDKRGTIEYRIKVAGVLARRAAAIAFERAAARA